VNPIVFVPIASVTLSILIILILDPLLKRKEILGYISILLVIFSVSICIYLLGDRKIIYEGGIFLDNFSNYLIVISFFIVFLILLISINYTSNHSSSFDGFYPLLLFALSGMIIMVSSLNLLIIFLGLEILSISSYALSAIDKKNIFSAEAGTKYFLLGALSSAFLIFGIALVLSTSKGFTLSTSTSILGMALILVGFSFKLSLVPFHAWTPDVYEGSPVPSTTFFSLGPKIAGFAVLLRIFDLYFSGKLPSFITNSLWIISALSMILGNFSALRQRNIKRMLAYSSIAHSGYILMGFLSIGKGGEEWVLFYLLSYLFINGGAFASLTALIKDGKEYVELENLSGLSKRSPWLSAFLSLFLISLAGFPPTAGFLAKFYIFSNAIQNGYFWLTFIAIITTLISVYYYLRPIVFMYMKEEEGEGIGIPGFLTILALFIFALGALHLGIFPKQALYFILKAIGYLG
jgi:NADH-quinone oxidoreductase subunit N